METSLFFMNIIKKIIFSPVTYFNLLTVGAFVFIGVLHNQAHHSMDTDTHGYVKKFCRKNIDICKSYLID